MRQSSKIAIIGIGRWGKNLLAEFDKICDVVIACHRNDPAASRWLRANYPHIKEIFSCEKIFQDNNIEAVVIATPIKTHFEIAMQALKAGKHVFLEKPITDDVSKAKQLVRVAKQKKLMLFVGHIYLYSPIFQKIKKLVKNNPVRFASFYWAKWGHFTENIIWNLGCHEIATAIEILGKPIKATELAQHGFITEKDVVLLKFDFGKKRTALIHINRIASSKSKSATFVTKNNLLVWDNDSLYRFDKKSGSLKLILRSKIPLLAIECRQFIKHLRAKTKPYTDGAFGLSVVKVLSKIQFKLKDC